MKCTGTNWKLVGGKWKGNPCDCEATEILSIERDVFGGGRRYETMKVCEKHAKKLNEKYKIITQIKINQS